MEELDLVRHLPLIPFSPTAPLSAELGRNRTARPRAINKPSQLKLHVKHLENLIEEAKTELMRERTMKDDYVDYINISSLHQSDMTEDYVDMNKCSPFSL